TPPSRTCADTCSACGRCRPPSSPFRSPSRSWPSRRDRTRSSMSTWRSLPRPPRSSIARGARPRTTSRRTRSATSRGTPERATLRSASSRTTAAWCCRSPTTAWASTSGRARPDTVSTTCASGPSPWAARSRSTAPRAPAREYAWSYRPRWRALNEGRAWSRARGMGMSDAQVRVMLVDDHEVVREGLRTLIGKNKGLIVVAEAATMAEAIETAARAKPDVVIMDVRLPDGSGVEACRTIRETRPDTKVIMLTSYADDEALFASIVAGAAGYLLKQTRGQAVIDAITSVAQGRSLLDPDVTGKVLERVRRGREEDDPAFASLTDQERKVLEQLAEGKTNREIGEVLFLSEKTVKNYVSRILDKLGLSRRAEAAAYMAKRRPRF